MADLMNTAPCGFVSFADDGTVVEMNETLASMLGYTRVELLGWHFGKILPPGGRIFHQTHLFPLLKLHGAVEEIYLTLRTKDGGEILVLLNGVRREREARIVSDCVCIRMMQRHAYEDQLLQARRLAEEANAAKGRFLSMVSHDLRSPLTTIHGNAALLAEGAYGALNAEQSMAVRTILGATRLQMTLVTDILEFARLESGSVPLRLVPVPVADVVARAESLVALQMRDAGLRFTIGQHDPATAVLADPDRLQQVVLNLLTNAIKFTLPGGAVALESERAGTRVQIRVRDSGSGIAAAQIEQIFTPFVQLETDPARPAATGGVGLGLAISRELARAMDGDVTVESTPGAGSVFTIDLPAAEPLRF